MIQPPGGLFTQAGDPAPEYWCDDLANLRNFIDGFYEDHGLESEVTFVQLSRVEAASEKILLANVGIKTPSVFKRVAAFTLGFMQESPLQKALGSDAFSPELAKVGHVDNHQNAVIAFEYSRACLTTATYICGGIEVSLQNPIKVSRHFYADLIHALSTLPKKTMASSPSFHEMALLYESLAYHDNTNCHDPMIV